MRRFGWSFVVAQRGIGLGFVVLGLGDLASWVIGREFVVLGVGRVWGLVRRAIERAFGSWGWIGRWLRRGP